MSAYEAEYCYCGLWISIELNENDALNFYKKCFELQVDAKIIILKNISINMLIFSLPVIFQIHLIYSIYMHFLILI